MMRMTVKKYWVFCCATKAAAVIAERRNTCYDYHQYHRQSTTFVSLGRHRLWAGVNTAGEYKSDFLENYNDGRYNRESEQLSNEGSTLSSTFETDETSSKLKSKIRLTSLRRRKKKDEENHEAPQMASSNADNDSIHGMTLPLIPNESWEEMTGTEFEDPATVTKLSRSGLIMATQEEGQNPWVSWKATKDTEKALESQPNVMSALEEGNVLVYVGKAKLDGFGSHLPIIKSQSILQGLSAKEVAELLMDSSKVKIYNKMSLGRTDVKVITEQTKIVRNLTRPPVAKNDMVSVTLMHSRPLQEEDLDLLDGMNTAKSIDSPLEGYLVVSRAVPGADTEFKDIPRNDILLGVNLLQDVGPNECMMTAVTHVYSTSVPSMLAARFGVKGATNFVQDLRKVAEPVPN